MIVIIKYFNTCQNEKYHPVHCSDLVVSGCNQSEETQEKPNIIYILADDLGYGDLGCYGQTEIKTPNLDKMAAEGIRFTQHYAGNTVCAPSRCVLMTGLHTGHAKIRANGGISINEEDVTVASLLNDAGYKTGIIGKWGLGRSTHQASQTNKALIISLAT